MAGRPKRKKRSSKRKEIDETIFQNEQWKVCVGSLKRPQGNPGVKSLFSFVAEKIPFEALDDVRRDIKEKEGLKRPTGVYIAHDSMGYARYVGRGNIFSRLKARFKAQRLELKYFSFYVVTPKKREREIETLIIRSAGPQLHFNTQKKRVDIKAGNIRDYEAGTIFYERHYRKGKRKKPA